MKTPSQPRALKSAATKPVVGWREWVGLPGLRIETIKAKVDTGARTSSLHAYDVVEFRRGRQAMVRFKVHPEQRNTRYVVSAEALLCDRRKVKSSSGQVSVRPVVRTTIELMGERWELELTLVSRDEMGFRMLLGRQAVRSRFLVDPGKSFLNGRRVKGSHRLKKKRTSR